MNLSCKAVLSAITAMEFAADKAPDYVPSEDVPDPGASFADSISRDPIATVRTLVRVVNSNFKNLSSTFCIANKAFYRYGHQPFDNSTFRRLWRL